MHWFAGPSAKHVLTGLRAVLILLSGGASVHAQDVHHQDVVVQGNDAPQPVRLLLPRPISAEAAPVIVALDRGLFRQARLAVSVSSAGGSRDAISRLAAGQADAAIADINALISYHNKAEVPAPKAVMMLQDRAAYAIIARKSRGIRSFADLAGKTLGVVESDPATLFWPALAQAGNINPQSVKQERISAAVRDPMVAAGEVDAVTGLSYLGGLNLRDRGIPADDLVVLRYADGGCAAYGLAVIVNPAFAAAKPEAVKSLLKALAGGARLAVHDPAQAVDNVLAHMQGGNRELELKRLQAMIVDTILTDDVKHDVEPRGFGALDPVRFEASLDQLALDIKFHKRPAPADIFDPGYLPPLAERQFD